MTLLTIGHGTLEAERFADLLAASDVGRVVDMRRLPTSGHNPQFGRSRIEEWLPQNHIIYRWEPDLGGFRRAETNSPNTGLRNRSFRGYADYMAAPAFLAALERLLAEARRSRTAVMCSETLWWRCHRRLIADAATLLRGIDVVHLMHDGSARPHVVTECAVATDSTVRYPPE